MLSQRYNLTLDLQRNEGPVRTNKPLFDVCELTNFPVQGLSSTMGMYGGEHIDTRDCPGSFTHVYALSDLPNHYYPGRFHLLEIGAYIVLNNHVGINFSGLYFHGSSPPYPPGNEEPLESAVRYAGVLYPPLKMTDGGGRIALASMPFNKFLEIPPELTNMLYVEPLSSDYT